MKDSFFYSIYPVFFQRLKLKGCIKEVLALIIALCRMNGRADFSISKMAQTTGYSEASVKAVIQSLKNMRYIKRISTAPGSRACYVLDRVKLSDDMVPFLNQNSRNQDESKEQLPSQILAKPKTVQPKLEISQPRLNSSQEIAKKQPDKEYEYKSKNHLSNCDNSQNIPFDFPGN